MKYFFAVFALLFAILFSWAAYLQNNDPDALLWYFIYGLAALACVLFLVKKLNSSVPLILALAYLIGAYFSWPAQFEGVEIGQGDINNIEHAREALGLIINAVVMLVLGFRIRFIKKKASRIFS